MAYWHSFQNSVVHKSSRRTRRALFHWLPLGMLAAALILPSATAQNQAAFITVHAQRMTQQINAYARVAPTSALPVNAAEAGVVSGLRVVPGMDVRAGEVLAKLDGPGITNLLLQDRANLNGAKTQMSAAQQSLAIQREQLKIHLSTREMVHQAASALAKTQAAVKSAEAQLAAVEAMRTITAPANGVVLALNSRNGQLLQVGQPIVTLETDGSLWLVGTYYGNDLPAIHPGMTGLFTPSDGEPGIAVKVAALLPAATPGGGESVALRAATRQAKWRNGESGVVVLNGSSRMLPVVPTRALILNQGKWWVMIHTAKGDQAQQVVPGPSEGWSTFIERGITPGMQVITTNAYLLFHSQITEHYQIPD